MGKIICEICGTVYPDSADACPICGYSRDMGNFEQGEDLRGTDPVDQESVQENYGEESYDVTSYDEFDFDEKPYIPPQPAQQSQRGKIFDYDAVNPQDRQNYDSYQDAGNEVTLNDYPEENYDNYDGYSEQPRKKHTGLIVFLILLIVGLFAASGFLLMKFVLPNMNEEPVTEPVPVETVAVTEAPTEPVPTTQPTIPCSSLVLVDGANVELVEAGQFFLIHAAVSPEDTTDVLTYSSEDESVATVDERGKITAVGEGSTNIILTCGMQMLKLPVQVGFVPDTEPVEDTLPPMEEKEGEAAEETAEAAEEGAEENAEETEGSDETQAEEEDTVVDGDIVLKLKDTDRSSGVRGVSFSLTLDCELKPEDVDWFTSDSTVATVKDGVVTTVGPGLCTITAKYGSQTATCIIRCTMQ